MLASQASAVFCNSTGKQTGIFSQYHSTVKLSDPKTMYQPKKFPKFIGPWIYSIIFGALMGLWASLFSQSKLIMMMSIIDSMVIGYLIWLVGHLRNTDYLLEGFETPFDGIIAGSLFSLWFAIMVFIRGHYFGHPTGHIILLLPIFGGTVGGAFGYIGYHLKTIRPIASNHIQAMMVWLFFILMMFVLVMGI